jgi:hypothetical protein
VHSTLHFFSPPRLQLKNPLHSFFIHHHLTLLFHWVLIKKQSKNLEFQRTTENGLNLQSLYMSMAREGRLGRNPVHCPEFCGPFCGGCFWPSPTSMARRERQRGAAAVQWWVGTARYCVQKGWISMQKTPPFSLHSLFVWNIFIITCAGVQVCNRRPYVQRVLVLTMHNGLLQD